MTARQRHHFQSWRAFLIMRNLPLYFFNKQIFH
nr:MAG TPA: hypothetical protein [Caudoviricetes sp.]